MTATQTQIRRDTDANLMTATPAVGELGYNQSTKRLHLGDGTTLGGTITPNAQDTLQMPFSYGTAGGSANALTLTLSPAPVSYAAPMRVQFKASATNSGAATINVNSLGVKNIYKVASGSIVALAAGDIVNGGMYELMYDGTQFQLLRSGGGLTQIGQGDLKTSTGTVSVVSGAVGNRNNFVLPGGAYGFYPQTRSNLVSSLPSRTFAATIYSSAFVNNVAACRIWLEAVGNVIDTHYADQRYVTASPPYDLGDGEVGGFIYVLVDRDGNINATYMADAPPWGYNGPTDIRATHIDHATGKKYKRALKNRNFEQIMDGMKPQYHKVEITQKIKNADMDLIPHPFGSVPDGCKVVMLDPMCDKVRRMIDYQNIGGAEEIMAQIGKGLIRVGNEPLKRCGPKGIMICKTRWR